MYGAFLLAQGKEGKRKQQQAREYTEAKRRGAIGPHPHTKGQTDRGLDTCRLKTDPFKALPCWARLPKCQLSARAGPTQASNPIAQIFSERKQFLLDV